MDTDLTNIFPIAIVHILEQISFSISFQGFDDFFFCVCEYSSCTFMKLLSQNCNSKDNISLSKHQFTTNDGSNKIKSCV